MISLYIFVISSNILQDLYSNSCNFIVPTFLDMPQLQSNTGRFREPLLLKAISETSDLYTTIHQSKNWHYLMYYKY